MPKKVKKERDDVTHSDADTCRSCGVAWDKHLGMIGTCAKLVQARNAFRTLRLWADMNGHDMILNFCDKTLAEIK